MPKNYLSNQLQALQNAVGKAGDAVDWTYGKYRKAMDYPAQMAGRLGGSIGAVVGGATNAALTPMDAAIQGKTGNAALELLKQNVMQGGREGYRRGSQLGYEGMMAAPLAGAGKAVAGAMAIPPIRDVARDIENKTVGLDTGLKAGAAAMQLYGAAKSPNWTPGGVLDPQLKALAGKMSGKVGIPGAGTIDTTTNYGANLMQDDGGFLKGPTPQPVMAPARKSAVARMIKGWKGKITNGIKK
jgi:hypothetical protein